MNRFILIDSNNFLNSNKESHVPTIEYPYFNLYDRSKFKQETRVRVCAYQNCFKKARFKIIDSDKYPTFCINHRKNEMKYKLVNDSNNLLLPTDKNSDMMILASMAERSLHESIKNPIIHTKSGKAFKLCRSYVINFHMVNGIMYRSIKHTYSYSRYIVIPNNITLSIDPTEINKRFNLIQEKQNEYIDKTIDHNKRCYDQCNYTPVFDSSVKNVKRRKIN